MAGSTRTVRAHAISLLCPYQANPCSAVLSISLRPEDAKSSLYILRPPGFDVNAEVSLMIAEANSHIDKDEVNTDLINTTAD
jgi:hypothetical protein